MEKAKNLKHKLALLLMGALSFGLMTGASNCTQYGGFVYGVSDSTVLKALAGPGSSFAPIADFGSATDLYVVAVDSSGVFAGGGYYQYAALYSTRHDGSNARRIWTEPENGFSSIEDLTLDSDEVFFIEAFGDGLGHNRYLIRSTLKTGGIGFVNYNTNTDEKTAITNDSNWIYFYNYTYSRIRKVRKNDSSNTGTVVDNVNVDDGSLTVESGYLFWTTTTSGTTVKWKVPVTGGTPIRV